MSEPVCPAVRHHVLRNETPTTGETHQRLQPVRRKKRVAEELSWRLFEHLRTALPALVLRTPQEEFRETEQPPAQRCGGASTDELQPVPARTAHHGSLRDVPARMQREMFAFLSASVLRTIPEGGQSVLRGTDDRRPYELSGRLQPTLLPLMYTTMLYAVQQVSGTCRTTTSSGAVQNRLLWASATGLPGCG